MRWPFGRRPLIDRGAGRGIGKAIALAFVEAGSKVAFVARTTREVEEATAEARQRFPSSSVVAITADVTKVADNARLLQETHKALGPVSTIVCAAGTNWFEPFVLSDDESWWQQVTVRCHRGDGAHAVSSTSKRRRT